MVRLGDQLAQCQGYLVRDARGREVGHVKWVRYESNAECPDALVVRPNRTLRRATFEVPTSRVASIDVKSRELTLSD
jgi:sporulation protein YlmC with PRC-barrel domain